jgi:3-isopropylmalate dehydrogenase
MNMTSNMTSKILLLSGDGIGPEIVHEAKLTLLTLQKIFYFSVEIEEALVGGHAIEETGGPLPAETLSLGQEADAILLGAVGGPKWDDLKPEHRPEKGLLQLRKHFQLFANLRPAILNKHLTDASSLKRHLVEDLDLLIVRELTGGLYFGEPRGFDNRDNVDFAYNTMKYYEPEIERIARVGFECAQKRNKKLCSVDKANVLEVSQLWRRVVEKTHIDYPDVALTHMYVDNAAMQLVHEPKQFDVIVTENMFGDILSDCAAMLTGSIGMLPSASLNESQFGVYEPVHGSAPDIAGQNKANPMATILSLGMLLRYSLKQPQAADLIDQAISDVLAKGYRTVDLYEDNMEILGTKEMGEVIRTSISALSEAL